jgi:lysozyme family protein
VLHKGGRSESARALQAATNRRLRARDLESMTVKEDGLVDTDTLLAVRKAAWALGAMTSTCDAVVRTGEIRGGWWVVMRRSWDASRGRS